MLNSLFEFLGKSINDMSRPVDAIKNHGKTVTAGTSRTSEKTWGILFESLADHDILNAQLISRNIIMLKNLRGVVDAIHGSISGRFGGLVAKGPTIATAFAVAEEIELVARIYY
jgi:glucosamine--fructose-6-phosphate aminotransferase (isomerizing)